MAERLRFQFTPNWRVIALGVLLTPVLVSLGFWQLHRADEKRQLLAAFQQKRERGPVPIEQLDPGGNLYYQPVRLRGEYLRGKNLLLDNRIRRGRFGYEVVTPFLLADSSRIVLVNRGWVPGDSSRRTLPAIDQSAGRVELTGDIYVPQGKPVTLAEERASGWPRVVQNVDIEGLRKAFRRPLFPYTVRLNGDAPGAYQPNWTIVNLTPARHTAYAVQWFAMSAALVLAVVFANSNLWALIKRGK